MKFPKMYRIRQRFDDARVENIGQAVDAELRRLSLTSVRPGQRVAITGGSRGIANIADILKAVVDHIKSFDAQPFIFPAMGSHGGATAQGQVAVLAQLGITESYLWWRMGVLSRQGLRVGAVFPAYLPRITTGGMFSQ